MLLEVLVIGCQEGFLSPGISAGTKRLCKNTLVVQTVKNLPVVRETRVRSLGLEDPLEKGMATHSSILA